MVNILKFLVISSMITTFTHPVFLNVDRENTLITDDSIKEFINENSLWGDVKTNGSRFIDNQKIDLQVTYENPEESLKKFKQTYSMELNEIQEKEGLDELSNNNYQDYYQILQETGEEYFGNEHINDVYSFFDIYENNDQNQKLISAINKYNLSKTSRMSQEDLIMEIMTYVPIYNENMDTYSAITRAQTNEIIHLQDINVAKASSYAKKYAVNPNKAYTYYGKDCTNFVSQIAYAGGLRGGIASVTWKPYTRAWINANTFCGIWGKRDKSTKWNTFVKKLNPGDFIATDFGGDGVIDHMAYVAANGSTSSSKYIAQHTDNYYEKSETTNWPNDTSTRILWKAGNKG